MTSPTTSHLGPALPPSPLTLGQALSSTFTIFRRRVGMFLGLALAPGVAIAILVGIGFLVSGAPLIAALSGTRSRAQAMFGPAVVIAIIVWLVIAGLALFIQIKANGMLVLLAGETAQDRRPTFDDLREGTKGIVSRTLLFVLVVLVAFMAIGLIVGLILAAMMAATLSGGVRSGPAVGGLLALLLVFYVAVIVAAVILQIRWLYWTQGLAIERLDGFAALGNSWRLSKGNFWRMFGWILVASLVIFAVEWVFMAVFGGLLSPLMTSASNGSTIGAAAATATSFVFMLAYAVLMSLITPLQLIYQTVMYVDQQRRNTLGPMTTVPTGYGYGTQNYAQSPYPQPGQPYGQAPSPYGQPQSPYGQSTPQYGQQPNGQSGQSPYGQQPYGQSAPSGHGGQPSGQQGTPNYGQPNHAPQPGQGHSGSQPPSHPNGN